MVEGKTFVEKNLCVRTCNRDFIHLIKIGSEMKQEAAEKTKETHESAT